MKGDIAMLVTAYAKNLEELDRFSEQIDEQRQTLEQFARDLEQPDSIKPHPRVMAAWLIDGKKRTIDGPRIHKLLSDYHESRRLKLEREDLMRQFGLERLIMA